MTREAEPVIVWNETLESAWTTEVFLTLFLRSLCSAWSIVHFDWAKFCLAALSLTFRGYEAGLFHTYRVISSRGLFFCRPAQCVCNRLLFYSKCTGFTVCFTYSDISLSFFFSGAHGQDPVVQWSSTMAERHHRFLTEPECKGSVEQRLKEGTPVRQNRPGIEPGPPETFPAQRGTWAVGRARTAIR